MKQITCLFLLIICIVCNSFSQSDSLIIPEAKNKTLLEEMLNSNGYMLKKEVIPGGVFRSYSLDILKVSNLETFQTASGIRLVQNYAAGELSKKPAQLKTYLDSKEVDELITTLAYMSTVVKLSKMPDNYTEIYFNSLAGSQLVLYLSQPTPTTKKWGLAFQINTDMSKTFTILNINDIETLSALLKAAKAKF